MKKSQWMKDIESQVLWLVKDHRLFAALNLTATQRTVLSMRIHDGSSFEKIGEALLLNHSYIRSVYESALFEVKHEVSRSLMNKKNLTELEWESQVLRNMLFVLTGKNADDHIRELRPILDTHLHDLPEIAVRTINCLRHEGVVTVGDVLRLSTKELKQIRNMGKQGMAELESALKKHGLELAP